MPTSSPVQKPDLKARLLAAAETEICTHGTTAISLRAVSRRAGVSHQAPGYAFENGAGLFTALAEIGFRTVDERIQAARDAQPPGTSPRAVIIEMGVAYVELAQTRPALYQVMYRDDLMTPGDPALETAKREAFETLFAAVRGAMDDGWHPHERLEQLALLCWSTAHGVAMLEGGLGFLVGDRPLVEVARDSLRLLLDDAPSHR